MKRNSDFLFRKSFSKLHPKVMPLEPCRSAQLSKLLKQAFILQSKEQFDSAIVLYEKITLSYPRNVQSRVNFAVCLIKLNMNERAIHILDQADSLSQENFYIVYNKSLAYFLQKDRLKALKVLKDAQSLEGNKDLLELKDAIINPFLQKITKTDMKEKKEELHPVQLSIPKTVPKSRQFQLSIEKVSSESDSEESSISIDSSASSKQLTLDDLMMKKEYLSRLLTERDTRLSILVNSPRFKPKTTKSLGFYQEDIDEKIGESSKVKQDVINVAHDFAYIKPINYEDQLLDDSAEKRLSAKSIAFILQEFLKPVEERDDFGLLKRFKKLPFFAKFPKDIQKMLIQSAVIIDYKIGDVIIKQGDIGECMFVILKGSVNIHRKAPEYHGLEIIVNSLYDGESFGELALLNNPEESDIRRTASCVAAETTTVVSISKENYCSIILNRMHNNIIEKIQFIRSLKFFTNEPWVSLIPFASSLEPKKFAVGEVVVEQGQVPKGMYILYKGTCRVYWEGYRSLPGHSKHSRCKPFFTGNYTPSMQSSPQLTFRLTESLNKCFYSTFKSQQRLADQAKAKMFLSDSGSAFKERIECNSLKEGDWFAGRAILDAAIVDPCKFTILSESKEAEIFIVEKKNLSYLGGEFVVYGN
jgi:CRP-like cAMP-binding protein